MVLSGPTPPIMPRVYIQAAVSECCDESIGLRLVFAILYRKNAESLAITPAPRVHGALGRLKKLLREKRGHECTQDHNRDKDRVLALIDNFVLEAEQGRDCSKSQACRHEQGRVSRFAVMHVMQTGQRPDADNLCQHL